VPAPDPFVQTAPVAAQPKTPALPGAPKDMDPAQMKREIERLRLELEQTRLLLLLANKEILELRAKEAEAARRDREKIRATKDKLKGLGTGGSDNQTPPDEEAVRKARAEEDAIRKAAEELEARRRQAVIEFLKRQAENEAKKAEIEAKKAKEAEPGKVRLMIFSPDQKIVAAAQEKSIALLDAATGKEVRRFLGHSHPITALAFTPDGKRLASGSKDKSVMLWDVASGKIYAKILQQDQILTLTFSADGSSLVIGHDGQTTEIDAATGKVIRVDKQAK
jgi:hypothetical protein